MFSQIPRSQKASELLGMSGLAAAGGFAPAFHNLAVVEPLAAGAIGPLGGFDFQVRYVGEPPFIEASRFSAVGIIELHASVPVLSVEHAFASGSLGETGQHASRIARSDVTKYISAERFQFEIN